MISSNEEIIIVNVDETNQSTLPGRKPLLTYTLAEKILKNHQVIHFKGIAGLRTRCDNTNIRRHSMFQIHLPVLLPMI